MAQDIYELARRLTQALDFCLNGDEDDEEHYAGINEAEDALTEAKRILDIE